MDSSVDMDESKEEGRDSQFILLNRFIVGHQIGSGSFSTVYFGRDIKTNARIAVKTEDIDVDKAPQLQADVAVLRKIRDMNGGIMPTGFTRLLASGVDKTRNIRYAIIELLADSLEALTFRQPGNRLTVHTVLMIADQALTRLQTMHDAGFIHRDIKLANFVMGRGPFSPALYIIDFGLTTSFLDESGTHIKEFDAAGNPVKGIIAGTLSYMSVRAHKMLKQSRRDDIEALAYVCIRMLVKNLPWKVAVEQENRKRDLTVYEKNALIMEVKSKTPIPMLCKNLPPVFARWIKYARNIRFHERPNYTMIRKWLHDVMDSAGGETMDAIYDWTK